MRSASPVSRQSFPSVFLLCRIVGFSPAASNKRLFDENRIPYLAGQDNGKALHSLCTSFCFQEDTFRRILK